MVSVETRSRIAWRVRLLRTARGWPRAVLAMEAGVDPLIIGAIEAAEPVNSMQLNRVARTLGVLQADLYDTAEWAVVKVLHRESDAEP